MVLFECPHTDVTFLPWENIWSLPLNRDYGGLKAQLGVIRSFGNTDADHTRAPKIEEKHDDSRGENPLDTHFVTEYEMHSFWIMIEAYLNRTSARVACSWVSGSDPTNDTAHLSGHGRVSHMRASNQESKPQIHWQQSNSGAHKIYQDLPSVGP